MHVETILLLQQFIGELIKEESFNYPTDAQLDCSEMLKFTLKFTWGPAACFSFSKLLSGSYYTVYVLC
jgi:hypothetical protein